MAPCCHWWLSAVIALILCLATPTLQRESSPPQLPIRYDYYQRVARQGSLLIPHLLLESFRMLQKCFPLKLRKILAPPVVSIQSSSEHNFCHLPAAIEMAAVVVEQLQLKMTLTKRHLPNLRIKDPQITIQELKAQGT